MKKHVLLCALLASCISLSGITPEAQAKGFVELTQVDPTIQVSLRYATDENFVGKPVDGYKSQTVLMTHQAAHALKKVQEEVNKDGYSLLIYDTYRPNDAVKHFKRWAQDVADQKKKGQYYPRVDKARLFELDYVAEPRTLGTGGSGHTRGSTVDLTLIKLGKAVTAIQEKKRTLLDGFTITLLDDGSEDMGSSFDLFDVASHYENNVIPEEFKARRTYLKNVMEKHGFKNYAEEWWHFTLKGEPYPSDKDSSYHNFPVE
jgi:D-alanyl-D-alanine dipeptidase